MFSQTTKKEAEIVSGPPYIWWLSPFAFPPVRLAGEFFEGPLTEALQVQLAGPEEG